MNNFLNQVNDYLGDRGRRSQWYSEGGVNISCLNIIDCYKSTNSWEEILNGTSVLIPKGDKYLNLIDALIIQTNDNVYSEFDSNHYPTIEVINSLTASKTLNGKQKLFILARNIFKSNSLFKGEIRKYSLKEFIIFMLEVYNAYKDDLKLDLKGKDVKKVSLYLLLDIVRNSKAFYPKQFSYPYSSYQRRFWVSNPKTYLNESLLTLNISGRQLNKLNYGSLASSSNVRYFDVLDNLKNPETLHIKPFEIFNCNFYRSLKVLPSKYDEVLQQDSYYKAYPSKMFAMFAIKREMFGEFMIDLLKGDMDLDKYVVLLVDSDIKTPTKARETGYFEVRRKYVSKLMTIARKSEIPIEYVDNLINEVYEVEKI